MFAASLYSSSVRLLSHCHRHPPSDQQPCVSTRQPAGKQTDYELLMLCHINNCERDLVTVRVFCVHADLWVLSGAEGVHRVEPEAAETRPALPVAGEGHARHPCNLQPQQPSSHHSAWHVHVLHHWPDSGKWLWAFAVTEHSLYLTTLFGIWAWSLTSDVSDFCSETGKPVSM